MIAICLVPFFVNAVGYKWPYLGLIIQYSRYSIFISVALIIFLNRGSVNRIFKMRPVYMIALCLFLFYLSAVINKGSISSVSQLAMYALFPFMLFSVVPQRENIFSILSCGVAYAIDFLVVTNLFIIIFYPEGIYQTFSSDTISKYYLFGTKNQMVAPVMLGLFFSVECAFQRRGRITVPAVIMCSISAYELYIGGSSTGLIILFAFIILVLLQSSDRVPNPSVTLIALAIFAFGIVVVRVQDFFSFIIVGILHKSLTLSDRVYIWDAALDAIKNNPILGTGITESLSGNVHLQLDYLEKDIFAHDIYLDIMLMGGIPSLVIFILLLLCLKRDYEIITQNNRVTLIWCGILVYLFASIVDIYTTNYVLYIMMAYISRLSIYEQSEHRLIQEGGER